MRPWMVSVLCSVLLPAAGFAEVGVWEEVASLNVARGGLGAAVVDGRIYAIGGLGARFPIEGAVEAYHPERDVWTPRAFLPTPRVLFGVCSLGGMIYAIGGAEVVWTAQVEAYDPKSDRWTQIAPLPTARGWVGAAAAFGRIYAIGGAHNTREYATVEEYNPATGEWRGVADLPETRAGVGVCTTRGKVYAVGGSVGRDDRHRVVDTLFEYDPQTDVWAERAPLLAPRSYVSAVSVGGRVYAIGGQGGGVGADAILDTVAEYNPLTDTWTEAAPLPCAVYGASAVAIGSTIYVVLGYTTKGWVSRVFKYDTGLSPLDMTHASKAATQWASVKAR